MKKGIYIRGLTEKNDPCIMAEKCAKHGITFAAFMTYWQEAERDKKINTSRLPEYVRIFDEAGIEPWVWAYPWCGRETALISRLSWAKNACEGRLKGFILDPELGYQGHRVGREPAKIGAKRLISKTLDIMDESTDLGITSFGAAHIHKSFPWERFCAGFASPQFYKTVESSQIRYGLNRWKKAGWKEFIPSVPAFGANSGQNLIPYLDKIKKEADTLEIPITGWIFWSYRQLNNFEWRIIKSLI